jgi:hypothetical protein
MNTETLQEKNEVQSLGNIYNEPYDISGSFGRIDDNNNNNTPDDESKI